MKFNLKNFPKTVEGENRDEADVWAENFEKELREMMLSENELPCVRLFISKEILGDKT